MEQDGSEGASCIHSLPTRFLVFKPVVQTPFKQSEDCLFLDLYIPGDVVRGFVKELAILHWLYGGGYGLFCSELCVDGSFWDEGYVERMDLFEVFE